MAEISFETKKEELKADLLAGKISKYWYLLALSKFLRENCASKSFLKREDINKVCKKRIIGYLEAIEDGNTDKYWDSRLVKRGKMTAAEFKTKWKEQITDRRGRPVRR